jgi:hypothetical protein
VAGGKGGGEGGGEGGHPSWLTGISQMAAKPLTQASSSQARLFRAGSDT